MTVAQPASPQVASQVAGHTSHTVGTARQTLSPTVHLLPAQQMAQMIAQQSNVLTKAEVYKLRNQVQLLPFNQTPRAAKLSDVLVPQDALQTAANAIAELLFNEGSIARVDASTVFRFREGLRRFQLPNRVSQTLFSVAQIYSSQNNLSKNNMAAANEIIADKAASSFAVPVIAQVATVLQQETIFVLDSGTALLMSPPNSVGTQVETPESRISIIAPKTAGDDNQANQPGTTASGLLLPPERSSAVMVVHDRSRNSTRVFALTDGDIRVSDQAGSAATPLIGGQTVAITNGKLGAVEEFDLATFYRTVPLAEGLGPGQESLVAQESARVQITLNAIRIETLAALRRQARAQSTFTGRFLRDALDGSDSSFNGQRGRSNQVIIGGEQDDGIFQRLSTDSGNSNIVRGSFTPVNQNRPSDNIEVDLNRRTLTINGVQGRSSDAGLSGNNATGTVQLENGRVIRLEVFGVGGNAPTPGQSYPGRIIRNGIQPDR